MKTFNDIYGTKGVFAIFDENFHTEFEGIFGDTAAQYLDGWTRLKYANRLCLRTITADNAEQYVNAVISANVFNWLQLAAAINTEININGNVETRLKTGTLSRVNSESSTAFNANKAFNDTDFVDNDKNTASSSGNNTDTYNLTETVNKGNNAKFDEIERQIKLRKTNLFSDIAAEIVNEITLRIY